MKTLSNNRYKNDSLIPLDTSKVCGYQACLTDLVKWIREETTANGFRAIDALELCELIENTTSELETVLRIEKQELENALKEIAP